MNSDIFGSFSVDYKLQASTSITLSLCHTSPTVLVRSVTKHIIFSNQCFISMHQDRFCSVYQIFR